MCAGLHDAVAMPHDALAHEAPTVPAAQNPFKDRVPPRAAPAWTDEIQTAVPPRTKTLPQQGFAATPPPRDPLNADGLRALFTTWITFPQPDLDVLVPAVLDGAINYLRSGD